MEIKIGTRSSKLALIQTQMVVDAIQQIFPSATIKIIPIITTGDKITDRNLYDIGGKALFLKEIEEQLIDCKIDLAVHSLKDVPGSLPNGLIISAVLERESASDCFVSMKYDSIDSLPLGAVVGTSSVRRRVLLHAIRPDLNIVQFRGNLTTRMVKLENAEVDASVLASCGLKRTALFDTRYCKVIDREIMIPAAGQGVIAIECREDDYMMQQISTQINHIPTWTAIQAERAFVEYLDASCRTPLAAYATITDDVINASYMLSNLDGSSIEYFADTSPIDQARNLGVRAAKILSAKVHYN